MKSWLNAAACISLVLLAAGQTSAVADEMSKVVHLAGLDDPDPGDPPPCGLDNICNIGVCQSDPDCPTLPVTKRLAISRFTTSTLNNTTADQIMSAASSVLGTKNGTGDMRCKVTLARNGNVGVFGTGNGIINSQQDFNTINGLSGNVKVVNQINFCGGLIPNVIGCAPVPGSSQIVVRFTANQEGILWAHEYGHTQGLNHRSDVSAVMNPTIAATRTMVTDSECNAYR